MIDFTSKDRYDFQDLVRLVQVLRAPGGCPWDGAQTHLSIRRNFLEEAYEACEGFDRDDPALMREELGDVLLQVLFHTDIEREAGRFTLDDVCDGVCKKLVFRHPFLFGGEKTSWDEIKKKEKGQQTAAETLDAVSRSLPATWRADKLQSKAAKSGVPTGSLPETLDCLQRSLTALREAAESGGDAENAMGEVLFAVVRASVLLQLDPEQSLHAACERFIRRFAAAEQAAIADGRALQDLGDGELTALWSPQSET